jgi:hypothetical protein
MREKNCLAKSIYNFACIAVEGKGEIQNLLG